jgi:drug/metabolite transporter (DMT)-like permease
VKILDIIELGLVVAGLVLIIAGWAQARFRFVRERRKARYFYWGTSALGIVFFGFGTGQLWPNAVITTLIFSTVVLSTAYFTTPYLKIGDQIYASSPENREPDPPVG